MSAAASIATLAGAMRTAWKVFCKAVSFKRRQIARAELEADNGNGKDLDGDGVVGGVGNTPASRLRLRRGRPERIADDRRPVLDEGGNPH
jgi:hypothetical protein